MVELKTILLADDNPKDVELTLEALSESNLANQVVVAKDGVEVLEFLRRQGKFKDIKRGDPAVVLLDIKMPRMDGIEVLRAIRTDPAFKTLPVVILTSSGEETDMIKSYELGVNAYVEKPVDFKEFIEAVKQIGIFWAVVNKIAPRSPVCEQKDSWKV
ncbi:MAG: response regulator [Ignavibacteriaceae bacterium]